MLYAFWNRFRRLSRPLAKRPQRKRPELELLEARDVPAHIAAPDYVLLPQSLASPSAGPGGLGYSPSQIRQAYGLTAVPGDGTGTTIAIVDAYDDPDLASDLAQFDSAFGLPAASLTKINENGGTTLPRGNTSWAEETALDVEWAHAIAPGANILLVEASSASFSDLLTAVKTAANHSGVVAVSMSWGGSEFSGETSYDSDFTTPSGHGGVSFITSSGDSGAPVSYPAASPNVLSVGGTTLYLTSGSAISSETGWSGSGGGVSTQESQPSYQKGVVTQTSTHRADPDVSYDADPNTGFPVYNSYSFPSSPWQEFGGTSDAAPQWAAMVAITDQLRAADGLGALDGAKQLLPMIYAAPAGDFNDVTSGSSDGSPVYSAGPGYDLVTGRGTPVANNLIPYLVGSSSTGGGGGGTTTATHFSVSAPAADTAGTTTFAITVTALSSSNTVVTNYAGVVQITSSDPQFASFTTSFTAGDDGVDTIDVTLKTAGSQSITVTDTSSGDTGSTATSVNPGTPSKLVFLQQPAAATVGAVISPAVTVELFDAYGNLETGDFSDQVSLGFGSNPGSATLGGTTTQTVSGGIATFANLTVSAAGNGYTLQATDGSLTATSNTFNISASTGGGGGGGVSGSGNGPVLIEGFETSDTWYVSGNSYDTAYLTSAAAHDGNYGLELTGNDWFYRADPGATVNAGDTLSAWVQFAGAADGRAYLGFGSSAYGTLSLVLAPNTGQLLLQSNNGYSTYVNLATTSESFLANHWYRVEVDWSTSGAVVGKVFDSNGTTLLKSVTTRVTGVTTGGIALRSIGSDKYWDTITDTPGVNTFTRTVTTPSSAAKANVAAMESAIAEYVASRNQQDGVGYWYWW